MTNMLDKNFIAFVDRHKLTFALIILILGNVYQYTHHNSENAICSEKIQKLNDLNLKMATDQLQYERNKGERLEYLLNNLSKPQPK